MSGGSVLGGTDFPRDEAHSLLEVDSQVVVACGGLCRGRIKLFPQSHPLTNCAVIFDGVGGQKGKWILDPTVSAPHTSSSFSVLVYHCIQ